MAALTEYGDSGYYIVTPEPLAGSGGQAHNDNIKRNADEHADILADLGGKLEAANNLSDVADASESLGNLGGASLSDVNDVYTYVDDLLANYLPLAGGALTGPLAASATVTGSSGVPTAFLSLTPTISQSGTAGYTALGISVTQMSTGSGAKNLIDGIVGGVSRFSVSNTGAVTAASFSGSGASLTGVPQSAVTNLVSDLALKAPLASPTFTGTFTAPSLVTTSTTLGTFGVTPSARASTTADIKDALTAYGLLQGTSATPLHLDGGTLTAGSLSGTDLTLSPGTTTASAINITQTWNSGGTTFKPIFVNVTVTGAAAASRLIDLVAGGVSRFNVTTAGVATATTFAGSGASLTNIPQSGVTSLTSDLALKAPLASPTFTGTVTLPSLTSTSTTLSTFGVTPVVRQSATTDIKDALTAYGLLQGTSASPLNLDGGRLDAGDIQCAGLNASYGQTLFYMDGLSAFFAWDSTNGFSVDSTGSTYYGPIAFFGGSPASQQAANPDTSGATLTQLETEVNQLKALLRAYGLMAT